MRHGTEVACPAPCKLYIAGLVVISTILLIATSLAFPVDPAIGADIDGDALATPFEIAFGIVFWMRRDALRVRAAGQNAPRHRLSAVSIAPVLAARSLGGPAVGAWVALVGTTEIREIRGRIPWYGTVANHAGMVPPAVGAGLVIAAVGHGSLAHRDFVGIMLGAAVFFAAQPVGRVGPALPFAPASRSEAPAE